MEKVLKIAKAEVGYLEKASNKYLDSKTANTGYNNYTKYGKWFGLNGNYWCAMFISWIFNEAYGKEKGKKLLCGGFSAACETIRQNFIKSNQYFSRGSKTPKEGDIIFFSGTRHSGANHIGIVYKVDKTKVYTIEGNSSNGTEVIDNGGNVCKRSYSLSYLKILGYGRPNYNTATTKETEKTNSSFKVGQKIEVTATSLNVRKTPNGTILGQLEKGHKCTLKAISNGWGKVCVIIRGKTVTGWICLDYVKEV